MNWHVSINQFILQSQLGKENIIQTPSRRNTGCEQHVWLCQAYMGQKAWNEGSSLLGKNTWWCFFGGTQYPVNKYCHDSHSVVLPWMKWGQPLRRNLGTASLGVMELHLDRVLSLGKPSPLKKITIWNKNQWHFNLHWVRSSSTVWIQSCSPNEHVKWLQDYKLLMSVCQFSKPVAGS